MNKVKIKIVHPLNDDFAAGQTYEVSEAYGKVLIGQGFAELAVAAIATEADVAVASEEAAVVEAAPPAEPTPPAIERAAPQAAPAKEAVN